MSPASFAESTVEEAALTWLEALGYAVLHGPDSAAGMPVAERHPICTRLAYMRSLRIIVP